MTGDFCCENYLKKGFLCEIATMSGSDGMEKTGDF
jgi:hypothetical protein